MYFVIDAQDQSVVAARSMGAAARVVLDKTGIELNRPGMDPVRLANEAAGDRLVMLNLSGMFESIAESGDGAAQELAASCKIAVDRLF